MAGQLIPVGMQTTPGGVVDEHGVYHADPMWKRYQQSGPVPGADALEALQGLFSSTKMPPAPGVPKSFQPRPVGEPNISVAEPDLNLPDDNELDTSNLQTGSGGGVTTHAVPGTRMNVSGGMDNLDSVLEGLRTATGTQRGNYDPNGELYRLQDARRDELKRNLELEAKYPGNPNARNFIGQPAGFTSGLGGTQSDLAKLDEDIANNPVEIQGKQRADEQQRNYLARLAGYGSPAAQAQAQFALEKGKVESPLEVAKVQGQTLRDVEASKEKNAQAQLETLRTMLAGGMIPAGMGVRSGTNAITQQQIPATGLGAEETALSKLQDRLTALQRPSALNPITEMFYPGQREKEISDLKQRIADLQGRMGRGRVAAPAPATPAPFSNAADPAKRQQAIQYLQQNNLPVTEPNIQHFLNGQ